MRSRKVTHPTEEAYLPLPDDVPEIPMGGTDTDGSADTVRVCLSCGGTGTEHDGCDHSEIAVFQAPGESVRAAISRLQRAAREYKHAVRALGTLVTAECAHGRAEVIVQPLSTASPSTISSQAEATEAAQRSRSVSSPQRSVRRKRQAHQVSDAQVCFPFATAPVEGAVKHQE